MLARADVGHADFPVTVYGGTKSIVISTRTVMGGRNPFLGIAYVVVGGICILLGFLFTATHLIKPRFVFSPSLILLRNVILLRVGAADHVLTYRPLVSRKLGDHTYLTWNNEQPSTATATGREIRSGGADTT